MTFTHVLLSSLHFYHKLWITLTHTKSYKTCGEHEKQTVIAVLPPLPILLIEKWLYGNLFRTSEAIVVLGEEYSNSFC